MALNYWAILVVTLVAFVGGALWHGPIFGKLWMKIHHGDKKVSDSEMKKQMQGMWKLLVIEFIVTGLMINTLAFMLQIIPEFSGYHIAFMAWIGFVVPMTISNIIWGGDKKGWMVTKIFITITYRLIVFMFAAWVLSSWI